MSLTAKIEKFLDNPFPLWENELTSNLVAMQWKVLEKYGIWPDNYTTSKGLYCNNQLPDSARRIIWGDSAYDSIQLESSEDILQKFYNETGLEIVTLSNSNTQEIATKVTEALKLLDMIPGMMDCLRQLVKTIQVIRQDDPEIDTSHTDPAIPFSIFISVCEDLSPISNLRVAESILHEAMHLKLTLLEKHIDLIVPGTEETFYSPWRGEQRPVRGVLHGLFVFFSIKEFYKIIYEREESNSIKNYLRKRLSEIATDFKYIKNFYDSKGLSEFGKKITLRLLQ